MAEPEGIATVCNRCARELREGECWADPCACGGTLNQHEDRLELELRRLEGIRQVRAGGGRHTEVVVTEQVTPATDAATRVVTS
jgi:hypothetical protein